MAFAGRATVTFASDNDTLAHIWSQASDAGSESLHHLPSDALSRMPSDADSLVQRRSSAMGDKALLHRQSNASGAGAGAGGMLMRKASSGGGALMRKASSGGGALMRKASSGAGMLGAGAGARRPGRLQLVGAELSPEAGEAALLSGAPAHQLLRAASSLRDADATAEEQTVFENAEEAARLQDVKLHFASLDALDMADVDCPAGGMLHLHNAVRGEVEAVVTMLCALRRLGAQLTVGDLMQFQQWWDVATAVFDDCLELHTRVVLPWLRIHLGATAPPALTAMPVDHCALRRLLEGVSTSFERAIEGSPRADQIRRERLTIDLVVAFDRLITRLITHLHALQTEVADPLEEALKDANTDVLREELLKQLIAESTRSGKQSDIVLLLLGRWADTKAQRKYAALLESSASHSYNKLSTHYEMHHGAMVAVFKVRAGIR